MSKKYEVCKEIGKFDPYTEGNKASKRNYLWEGSDIEERDFIEDVINIFE